MSKYLTYDQRLEIEAGLKKNLSFGAIAKTISKDRTTISKEIKRNHIIKKTGYNTFPYNACKHRTQCSKSRVCDECKYPKKQYCRSCKLCNDGCSFFEEEVCISKFKPPYVCNGCINLSKCTLAKPFYSAINAHNLFTEKLSEARSGIIANEIEIARINKIISPLVRNGQSIHQVYVNNIDKIMCSEKTLYNYIDACVFDVRNIDLPRKVKFRPRYKKPEFKVDKGCRIDRNYKDFIEYMNHVNSYTRKKLNDKSPYDAFSFYYGEDILRKLGYAPVAAENIILKPRLFSKKK